MEKPSRASSGMKEDFCYLPGFTGLKECRFNLFYCDLTASVKCFDGAAALGVHSNILYAHKPYFNVEAMLCSCGQDE